MLGSKKIKTIFVIAATFFTGGRTFASAIDIEIPLSLNFAKTQAQFESKYSDTFFLMFPVTVFKPLKIEYVFLPKNPEENKITAEETETPKDNQNSGESKNVRNNKTEGKPEKSSKWIFSTGSSFSIWPYQFLGACGKIAYPVKTFENDSTLEIAGTIDAGIVGKISSYFNTSLAQRVTYFPAGPAAAFSLQAIYRMNKSFSGYAGLGPSLILFYLNDNFYINYGFDLTFGIRTNS